MKREADGGANMSLRRRIRQFPFWLWRVAVLFCLATVWRDIPETALLRICNE